MPANLHKPSQWVTDVADSVALYNSWFTQAAPTAFQTARTSTAGVVLGALNHTQDLANLSPNTLRQRPEVMRVLRMATAPPFAVERLAGFAGVSRSFLETLEGKKNQPPRLPPRMKPAEIDQRLTQIEQVIRQFTDKDIFPWLALGRTPSTAEKDRAVDIVSDRLCSILADPIVRNAHETRQLALVQGWLTARGYTPLLSGVSFNAMPPGTFAFQLNVPVQQGTINLPVDALIQPLSATQGDFPLLIEAKSAGDFANPNKRRKEEAQKYKQLREMYGNKVRFVLFLCGYFNLKYLRYEADEGIDWIWEHRVADMAYLGL